MSERLVVVDRIVASSGVIGDAVLLREGRVLQVGAADDLRRAGLAEDRFPGLIGVPGLIDAHLHPIGYAAALVRPNLKDAADFAEVGQRLRAAAADLPVGAALTALRLDDETLAEGRLPDRSVLDEAVPDRPVVLVRYCGHIAVANTVALELAGVNPETPDPAGGSFDRDLAGVPNGILRETAADLVTAACRSVAPPVGDAALLDSFHRLAGVGLAGVGAMVSTSEGCWAGAGSELDALIEIGTDIPIDVAALVIASSPQELRSAAKRIDDTAGPRFGGVKMFSDGSLGGHTAAMHEPFHDHDGRGTDRLDPAWAADMARTALDLGGMVAIHAIGDRANANVLDLMEEWIGQGADPGSLRLEHASVLTRPDIQRCAALGIHVSVQPAFIASETEWLEKRVGPQRLPLTYPFRSLLDVGARLAGGSDCPVEPPHPLWGMAAARDRCGLVPDEALTASEALALFTDGAGAAIGRKRPLSPGSSADLTLLDIDPLEATPYELRSAHPVATIVGGRPTPVPPGEAWVA